MKCPRCKEEFIILELEGIEIEFCHTCKGVWIDDRELKLIFRESGTAEFLSSLHSDYKSKERARKCPVCGRKMEKVLYDKQEKGNVLLDRCRLKHGLWFDANELALVILMGSGGQANEIEKVLINMTGFHYQNKGGNN